METFSNQTKFEIWTSQNGYCRKKGCLEKIHSYHHRLSNNEANREKFPLLIHSVLNCTGLCSNCHTNHDYLYKITEAEATIYERFLQELKGE